MRDAAGRVVGVVSLNRDVTERVAMERALAERVRENGLFRQVLEGLPDPVWVRDGGGRFAFANPATALALGAPGGAAALAGRRLEEVLPPAAARRAEDRAVIEGGRAVVADAPFAVPGRGTVWLSTAKVPFRDEAGRAVGVFGHARDVTELRAAREAAEAAREAAEAAHATPRDAVEVLDGGFAVFDAHDRLTLCNAAFARAYGAPAEALLGPTFEALQRRPAFRAAVDLRGLPFEAWLEDRLARHRAADGAPWENRVGEEAFFVRERRTRDGRLVLARTRVTPLKRAEEALRRLAATDPLTGLANRRAFAEAAGAALARCRREGRPAALLIADVDRFKAINDRFGHGAGDLVPKGLAAALAGASRGGDRLARWGGEGFALLLPGADAAEARRVAERLRAAAGGLGTAHAGRSIRATLSLGFAVREPGDGDGCGGGGDDGGRGGGGRTARAASTRS